jgi:hypothetical protein
MVNPISLSVLLLLPLSSLKYLISKLNNNFQSSTGLWFYMFSHELHHLGLLEKIGLFSGSYF